MIKNAYIDLLRIFEKRNVDYAVLYGKYTNAAAPPHGIDDMDVVIGADDHENVMQILHGEYYFRRWTNTGCLKYVGNATDSLCVDLYSGHFTIGRIKIFPTDAVLRNARKVDWGFRSSDEHYLIYQVLDPMFKFGGYKERHITRLSAYAEDPDLDWDRVRDSISAWYGSNNADQLIRYVMAKDFSSLARYRGILRRYIAMRYPNTIVDYFKQRGDQKRRINHVCIRSEDVSALAKVRSHLLEYNRSGNMAWDVELLDEGTSLHVKNKNSLWPLHKVDVNFMNLHETVNIERPLDETRSSEARVCDCISYLVATLS